VLVALDVADRHELLGEPACFVSGRPAPLALEREGILLLARDRPSLRHVLTCLAHRLERKHGLHAWVREAPAERRVPDRLVAALGLAHDERRAAHGLHASGDKQLTVPGPDCVTRSDHRAEA
jgi:hypothetical protein